MAAGKSRTDEHRLERALKAAALENHPNPNRTGCPSDKEVLRLLAALKLRPSDPAVQHVAECSPCLAEVLKYRENFKRKRALTAVSVTATIVLIFAAVLWIVRSGNSQAVQIATIDLRPFTISRGADSTAAPNQQTLLLSRSKLQLTILLPVGAQEGSYEFKLLNDSLQMVRSGTGHASLRMHVTTISTELDTTGLAPGRYSLWLRQPGRDWRSYDLGLQ